MSENEFKKAIVNGKRQIGLWLNTGEAVVADIVGRTGFDWLVIDGEHGPNDLRSIMRQLQVLDGLPVEPVVRPPVGSKWMIKQLLDIGARTLLIPMVNTPEEAAECVRSVRYPPNGDRGMGAIVARASRYGTVPDYAANASDEICLLVQVETKQALENLDAIARTDGVDGVFIGPADLSADIGQPLRSDEVLSMIDQAIETIVAAGKPAGILTFDEELNRRFIDKGASFVAVGADVTVLLTTLASLSNRYKDVDAGPAKVASY
ncbi:2-keto-3-deoxy-L-rhamnonate aldolase [Rhizobiales bacterium RZME27]|uniref:2-keto-3-deoxy-L-rhamnonate aldolase n=1 Tax=Endobacterium cereale TaxID=2663029 RepID=A0A6A8ADI9_9HYPH|nr:HpcH/HpaI aldolase/citrate lyase family protein [Endobacterium cereale]MEB2847852.1 HpcH/HpaI aldolase/citrate lyase family protein [Endobacterium cereale]MQY46811.1 2-keto-3-deoxy-L-rhamnonate aldolase [Endobacterium cereale]